jgi:hypothetical protein
MTQSKKKRNKPTETVPANDLKEDLLDKDFETTVLKMLQRLNENVEKVKKISIRKMEISIKI